MAAASVWRFHPNHGGNVRLSPDYTVAENVEDVFGAVTGFLVFTDAPVPLGSQFVLRGIDAPLYQPVSHCYFPPKNENCITFIIMRSVSD